MKFETCKKQDSYCSLEDWFKLMQYDDIHIFFYAHSHVVICGCIVTTRKNVPGLIKELANLLN